MRVIIVMVNEETAPLRIDPEEAVGARLRIRLDWRTFVYLVAAILGALLMIAVFRGTETMLTRIGIGLLIALALDPLTNAIRRWLGIRRGLAVGLVALFVFGLAALLIAVLGPRAVERGGQVLRTTAADDQRARGAPARRRLPARQRDRGEGPGMGARPAGAVHRRASRRRRRQARQRDRQRRHRRGGRHRRADRRREHARPESPVAEPAATGAGGLRRRGDLPDPRSLLRRVGHGRHPHGLVRARARLAARHPARPAGGRVGDAHGSDPTSWRLSRRVVPRDAGPDPRGADGTRRRGRPSCCT